MKPSAVRIQAEGANRAHLFGKLSVSGVTVYNAVSESPRKFAFTVTKKDLQKTFAILDELCYTYVADKHTRAAAAFRSAVKRVGFVAGVLLFSVLIAVSKRYVWRIDITGNESVPDKVIENALSDNHISVGKPLGGLSTEVIESAVGKVQGIKFVSARIVGTTVKVEVFESDAIAPPLAFSDSDIVSDYDATVTRVVVREGTALTAPGQNVFRGTPLIGAYRIHGEEEPVKTRAGGVVYGKVAFTKSVTVATEQYVTVSVNTKKRTRLKIFGLTVGRKLPQGDEYEIAESGSKLNVFLPVTVLSARITRTERVKVTFTPEELASREKERIVSEFINKNVTSGFTATQTMREIGGGLWQVNVFIEAEMVIGGA